LEITRIVPGSIYNLNRILVLRNKQLLNFPNFILTQRFSHFLWSICFRHT
jgi:hypothetical protein